MFMCASQVIDELVSLVVDTQLSLGSSAYTCQAEWLQGKATTYEVSCLTSLMSVDDRCMAVKHHTLAPLEPKAKDGSVMCSVEEPAVSVVPITAPEASLSNCLSTPPNVSVSCPVPPDPVVPNILQENPSSKPNHRVPTFLLGCICLSSETCSWCSPIEPTTPPSHGIKDLWAHLTRVKQESFAMCLVSKKRKTMDPAA